MSNIQELQKQVIALLQEASHLMSHASTQLWFEDGSENKYKEYQQEVDKARRNVENLELRMAITAPMNAGKSTIINAIIGQELLPSCSTAMTTLPTEIVFKADSTESILDLTNQIISSFQEAFQALKNKINQQGIEKVLHDTAEYPHLADLLHRIDNYIDFPVPEKIVGCEAINRKLTDLNHIIRLCSILELPEDPLKYVSDESDIPKIETPFWQSQQNNQPDKLGNLIIIDTPGPNEAGVSSKLESVVSKQLRNSQLILLVLDFTSLRAEAAEKIKEEVQKVIRTRGTKNLYVLVNKVDQRGDGDITPDEVKKFVTNNFKLIDSSDIERVFEISAKQAFLSAVFIQELGRNTEVKASDMKTSVAFAKQAFGMKWKKYIDGNNKEQLGIDADEFWQESGFPVFIEKAINAIMEEVAPRCMESALNLCIFHIELLCKSVQSRRSTINSKAEELIKAINELNKDISDLSHCRHSLKQEVEKIKKQLDFEINRNLNELKKEVRDQMNKLLLEYAFESFKNLVSKFRKNIFSRESGGFEFENQDDAKLFAKKITDSTKEIIENQLNIVSRNTEEQTEQLINNLSNLLETRTQPIIEIAKNRLKKDFDINLDLDPLKMVDVYTSINEPNYFKKFKYFDFSKILEELFLDILDSILSFLTFRNPLTKAITQVINAVSKFIVTLFGGSYKEQKQPYTLELNPYIRQVMDLFDNQVEIIRQQAKGYIDDYVTSKVNNYFGALDLFLGEYKIYLEQSLNDKNLTNAQIEQLKQVLDSFSEGDDRLEIDKLIENSNNLLQETQNYYHHE